MSAHEEKGKIDFDNSKKNEGAYPDVTPDSGISVFNSYTLVGILYCIFSSVLFFSAAGNNFLGTAHIIALASVLANYLFLLQTKKQKLASNILLGIGAIVVVILFATGGWENTGYLWPLVYMSFAFFLTEKTTGIIWVLVVFCGSMVAMLLHVTGAVASTYSAAQYVEYFGGLLMITAALYIFSKATMKRDEFFQYANMLLEAAPDSVIVMNDRGEITRWNKKAESLFGWKAGEVKGKLLSAVIIPLRYREAHKKGLEHFLKTGQGPVLNKTIDIKALNRNNKEFDVALSVSAITVKDRVQFIGFVRAKAQQSTVVEQLQESDYRA